MTVERDDCVVIGRSLAGLVCAVRLRRLGHRVVWADHPCDGFSAEGIWELPFGPSHSPMRGELVIGQLLDECDRLGVEYVGLPCSLSCSGGRVQLGNAWDEVELDARTAILAAVGTSPLPPGFTGGPVPLVSADAWSDAAFYRGQPVAVIGSGMRAASEALHLASKGAQVTVLCEAQALDAPPWIAELEASPSITLLEGVQIDGPRVEDRLVAVRVRLPDGETAQVSARMVFTGLEPGVPDPPKGARECVDSGLAWFVGVAAGLGAWDFVGHLRHAEQVIAAVHERLVRAS